jgi:hypothetical protein
MDLNTKKKFSAFNLICFIIYLFVLSLSLFSHLHFLCLNTSLPYVIILLRKYIPQFLMHVNSVLINRLHTHLFY